MVAWAVKLVMCMLMRNSLGLSGAFPTVQPPVCSSSTAKSAGGNVVGVTVRVGVGLMVTDCVMLGVKEGVGVNVGVDVSVDVKLGVAV